MRWLVLLAVILHLHLTVLTCWALEPLKPQTKHMEDEISASRESQVNQNNINSKDGQLFSLPGRYRESVSCREDLAVTYASYIPSTYNLDKKDRSWPLLLLFDPDGKGSRAVMAYAEAAEIHGFILASCNQVKQQFDVKKNKEAAEKTWIDLMERFSIHLGRCFLGGSGPIADFALETALNGGCAGLLTVGWIPEKPTALISESEQVANRLGGLPLSAACGRMDGSFPQVLSSAEAFMRLETTFCLRTWSGNEVWPTGEIARAQLDYLVLSENPKNSMGEAAERRRKELGKLLLAKSQEMMDTEPLEAERLLHGLSAPIIEGNHLHRTLLAQLRARSQAQKAAEELGKVMGMELSERKVRNQRLNILVDQVNPSAEDREYWEAERVKLARSFLEGKTLLEREAAGRELDWLAKSFFNRSVAYLDQKQYRRLAQLNQIAAVLFPDNPFPYFNLVTAYTQMGQIEEALSSLATCRDRGMPNLSELRRSPLHRILWELPRFQELTK